MTLLQALAGGHSFGSGCARDAGDDASCVAGSNMYLIWPLEPFGKVCCWADTTVRHWQNETRNGRLAAIQGPAAIYQRSSMYCWLRCHGRRGEACIREEAGGRSVGDEDQDVDEGGLELVSKIAELLLEDLDK